MQQTLADQDRLACILVDAVRAAPARRQNQLAGLCQPIHLILRLCAHRIDSLSPTAELKGEFRLFKTLDFLYRALGKFRAAARSLLAKALSEPLRDALTLVGRCYEDLIDQLERLVDAEDVGGLETTGEAPGLGAPLQTNRLPLGCGAAWSLGAPPIPAAAAAFR